MHLRSPPWHAWTDVPTDFAGIFAFIVTMTPLAAPTEIERLTCSAWPALETEAFDGWLLRFARGYTRRSNSVQPLSESSLSLDDKVTYCESAYAARSLRTVFKLTSAAQPPELDGFLEKRGYAREAPTSVQLAELGRYVPDAAVSVDEVVSETWIDAFCRISNVDPWHRPTMAAMLASIAPACAFGTLHEAGETLALGLAVVEHSYVGLFDIVTAAHARNRGLGRRLVSHLLQWGVEHGARVAHLGVMLDNAPAIHLYASLGFVAAYRYWYRVQRA